MPNLICSYLFKIILVALICSCSTTKDKELQPVAVPVITNELQIESLWKTRFSKGGFGKHQKLIPVFNAGNIFVANAFGAIAAYSADTGKQLWQVKIERSKKKNYRDDGSFVSAALGSNSKMLFVSTIYGDVIALSQVDGKQLWRTALSSEVLSPPQSDGVLVYIQTADGKLISLEAGTGKTRWSYNTQEPVLSLRGTGSPLLVPTNIVISGFANAKIVAFQALTGQVIWEQQVSTPEGRTELDRISDIDGSMASGNGILFVASYQGRLRGYILNTGQVVLEKIISTHRQLAIDQEKFYVIDDDDHILALEQLSVNTVWNNAKLHRRRLSDPVIFNQYLVVGDYKGYVYFINLADGKLVASQKVLPSEIITAPLVRNDKLYVLDINNNMTALNISDIKVKAPEAVPKAP